MIEDCIRAIILNSPAITAVAGTRVRPVSLSDIDALPFVAYQVIDAEGFDCLDQPIDWTRETVQIDVYAETNPEAVSLSKLIKNQLHYFAGFIDLTTGERFEIASVLAGSVQDLTAPAEVGKQAPTPRQSCDYRVLFREVQNV